MLAKLLSIEDSSGSVDMNLIVDFAKQGVKSNDPRIRFYLWQLLLYLLPQDRSRWKLIAESQRDDYMKWIELYMKGSEDWVLRTFPLEGIVKEYGLERNDFMFQIHGDICRTPEHLFYEYKLVSSQEEINGLTRRFERVLYLFSCLNPRYTYTQGFNELLTPIYHVVNEAHKILKRDDDFTEAISFFLLQSLITSTGIGELFNMDRDFQAVDQQFNIIQTMLKICDKEIHDLFIKNGILPLHFAFSWVSVLFNQIYVGEPLLILWDRFLLTRDYIVEYAMAMATAHIIDVRDSLIHKDYTEILDYLHRLKELDPPTIISRSEDIWAQYLGYS